MSISYLKDWLVQILLRLYSLKFVCLHQSNYRLILSTSVEKRNIRLEHFIWKEANQEYNLWVHLKRKYLYNVQKEWTAGLTHIACSKFLYSFLHELPKCGRNWLLWSPYGTEGSIIPAAGPGLITYKLPHGRLCITMSGTSTTIILYEVILADCNASISLPLWWDGLG